MYKFDVILPDNDLSWWGNLDFGGFQPACQSNEKVKYFTRMLCVKSDKRAILYCISGGYQRGGVFLL